MGRSISEGLSVHVTQGGVLVHTRTSRGYGVWVKVQVPPETKNALRANNPTALALIRDKVTQEMSVV